MPRCTVSSPADPLKPISAGFFDPVHPSAVMVLGDAATRYLSRLSPARRRALPAQLRKRGLRVLVARRRERLDPGWERAGVVIWRSAYPAHETVFALRRVLRRQAERATSVHGVLLSVHGVGVLLEGVPGAGKSSLALELVARGHALVADDLVELVRRAAGVVVGHAPEMLHGYLEARGLGVLDLRALHGRKALRREARLELIVTLVPGRAPLKDTQRLSGRRSTRTVLDEPVPVIALPATGARLPALIEAACLDLRAREAGEGADERLSKRQARAIARGGR